VASLSSFSELLSAPAKQSGSLRETAHRPWPLPGGSWVQGQTWENLLFAHWRVSVDDLRKHVPPQVDIDVYDGSAWLGITPFRVTGLRLRGMLPLPVLSSFLELNVRTYVTAEDKPGIWFFSLDAEGPLVVEAARRTYRLPYFRARMSARSRGDAIVYESSRMEEPGRAFSGTYRPTGRVFHAEPGSLEWFLAERYCLYTLDERQQLARGDIHHGLWPLQPAEAEVELNTMPPDGIALPDGAPLAHYSRRQDVVIWPLEPVSVP
jgi:uncharacterized protein YqjF (DUF2071 family)